MTFGSIFGRIWAVVSSLEIVEVERPGFVLSGSGKAGKPADIKAEKEGHRKIGNLMIRKGRGD
jgi:hypothetical protein